jgi:hypothetical protein
MTKSFQDSDGTITGGNQTHRIYHWGRKRDARSNLTDIFYFISDLKKMHKNLKRKYNREIKKINKR